MKNLNTTEYREEHETWNMKHGTWDCLLSFCLLSTVYLLPFFSNAQTFNSSSFQVLQPMVNTSQTGSSTSFQLTSTIASVSVLPARTSGPTISSVTSSLTADTSAVITWKTDVLASSTLSWGPTTAYGSTATSAAMTVEHALAMTSLSAETLYYYKVTSYDALGNASTSDNGGAGHTLTTAEAAGTVTTVVTRNNDPRDLSAPLIGVIDVRDITGSSAVISFTTTKLANSIVKYRTDTSVTEEAGSRESYSKSHVIPLSGLLPNTDYFFRVHVSDVFDINNQSNEVSFKTVKTGAATSTVSFKPSGTLDQLSETDKSTIERFTKVVKVAPLTFITNAIKAFLAAIADNPLSSEISEESFTAAVSEAASKIIASPTISGTDISVKPEANRATVTWKTDKKADSLVAFAKGKDFKEGENPYTITVGFPDEQVADHKVTLENLDPTTLYHFQLRSQGRLGPIALSADQTFTTLSLTPEITNVRFSSITDDSATVEWETNLPTKNTITITNGRTGETITQEDVSFLKVHHIDLKDFTPSTNYTLRLKAVDEAGHTSFPSTVPFTTAISTTPPKVSQVRITTSLIPDQVDTVQTIISWKTDKPSTSQVLYGEGISKSLTQSTPEDKTYVKDHIVITTVLKPAQVYQVQVRSLDPQGHEGASDFYTTLTPRPKQSAIDLIFKNLDSTFGFLKL